MTKKNTTNKQPLIITSIGILLALGLVGVGIMKKTEEPVGNVSEIKIEEKKEPIINLPEVKKILTVEEQLNQEPIVNLIKSVQNRFEDTLSQERANESVKSLIKEMIEEEQKDKGEIENWGDYVKNITKSKLISWNKKHEEKFEKEMKDLTSNKEVKSIPVEEIAQNSPLYILQEKSVIQKELFEQWLLIAKDDPLIIDSIVNNDNLTIQVSGEKESQITEKENLEKVNALKKNEELNGKEVVAPVSVVEKMNVEKISVEEQKKKDLEQNKKAFEDAKKLAKDLEVKKEALNNELIQQDKKLKEIEDEIKKTKDELTKLEKEIGTIK